MAALMNRPYRLTPRRQIAPAQISYTGMRDSYDPTTANPRKAKLLQNVYPQDASIGGGTVGRPGFQRSGNQLGSIGARTGQRRIQYTKRDGTEWTLDVVGGLIYRWNWATRAHTAIPLVGVALSTTARVYYVLFNDAVIISDGVNVPFMLSESGGVWTFTSLTNAPVAYGKPVVYAAKLFFIKAAERTTIVWSEENQPNVGYEAGGYNNAWALIQTEQEGLYALLATEGTLYYFRARSIGAISGAVTPAFATSATTEGVSQTLGTTSPGSVILAASYVWFLDADGHPQRFAVGGTVQLPEIWLDARETTRRLPRIYLESADAVDWLPANLVYFGVVGIVSTTPNMILAFDAQTGEFVAVHRGFSFTSLDIVKDADMVPTLGHTDIDGYAYDHGHPQGILWTDSIAGVATAISHIIEGTPIAFDVNDEKHFTRVDLSLRMSSQLTNLTFDYATPSGQSDAIQIASVPGAFSVYGVAIYGQDNYAAASLEQHIAIGVDGEGRSFRPRLRHNGLGEQIGVLGIEVEAFHVGAPVEAA